MGGWHIMYRYKFIFCIKHGLCDIIFYGTVQNEHYLFFRNTGNIYVSMMHSPWQSLNMRSAVFLGEKR